MSFFNQIGLFDPIFFWNLLLLQIYNSLCNIHVIDAIDYYVYNLNIVKLQIEANKFTFKHICFTILLLYF